MESGWSPHRCCTFDDLTAICEAAGAGDRCHLVVGSGGHRFYAADAWPVMLRELERAGK